MSSTTWCQSLFSRVLYRAGPTRFTWRQLLDRERGGSAPPCRGLRKATGCKPKAWVKKRPRPISYPTHDEVVLVEEGVAKYFRNRNPRSPELLGVAPKPKGYQTGRWRVDYHHRHAL